MWAGELLCDDVELAASAGMTYAVAGARVMRPVGPVRIFAVASTGRVTKAAARGMLVLRCHRELCEEASTDDDLTPAEKAFLDWMAAAAVRLYLRERGD